jgi:hypothetical protein
MTAPPRETQQNAGEPFPPIDTQEYLSAFNLVELPKEYEKCIAEPQSPSQYATLRNSVYEEVVVFLNV